MMGCGKTEKKKDSKDKDNLASLDSDESEMGGFGVAKKHKRRSSAPDLPLPSNGELSFRVGDQIDVVTKVLDGWLMSEVGGKCGLFLTTYTEVINLSSSSLPQKPPLQQHPP